MTGPLNLRSTLSRGTGRPALQGVHRPKATAINQQALFRIQSYGSPESHQVRRIARLNFDYESTVHRDHILGITSAFYFTTEEAP
jgi:hypothetical protein